MKITATGKDMTLLSYPSKMPGASCSISTDSCVASALSIRQAQAQGSDPICLSCYAEKGFYRFHEALNDERYEWAKRAVKDKTFFGAMTAAIEKAVKPSLPYFRIHDGGDFFSVAHVREWMRVCWALPHIHFWAPTRTHLLLRFLPALQELASLPNVTVRPSANGFEEPPPVVPGLHAGSSAAKHGYNCLAHLHGNNCGDCRICWDEKTVPVIYRRH